ncbi:MAG: hypothetical protein AAFU69_07650 [Pseudomonadota bacterium]
MTRSAIPLPALVSITFCITLIVGIEILVVSAQSDAKDDADTVGDISFHSVQPVEVMRTDSFNAPPQAVKLSGLLERSPFVSDRSPYSPPSKRKEPAIELRYSPKLLGITSEQEERHGLILWAPYETDAKSFTVGDQSPWGEVATVSPISVSFSDGRELQLFE